MIKPMVSGRAPQTTKATPAHLENFSARSYTQRVGAANAVSNNSGNFVGSGPIRQHHLQKGPVLKQARSGA